VLVVALPIILFAMSASAGDSSNAHRYCMENFQSGSAIALHERFKPLTRNEEEWDRLVSVVLETWHEACFSLFGVPDNRVEEDQMPWVSPGMICGGET